MSHGGIDIGDRITLRATFRLAPTPAQLAAGEPGTPTNPTTVVLRIRRPNGSTTVHTFGLDPITNPAAGAFEFIVLIAPGEDGPWAYRWEATGTVICAEEGSFVVRASAFL